MLAKLRPAFGGVQTGGNSSAIVDGAGAVLVASSAYAKANGHKPLARILASAAVGVPPQIMGIGPVPAIRAVLEVAGMQLAQIGRIEINEAFGAQILACVDELGLDENRLNVNGGAIAIGHPLGATGIRLALTLANELGRSGERYGIASACIGGGQGIALLIENPGGGVMEISGGTAFVTGGGSGLGAATARALARAGARVAIFDRDATKGEAVAGEIGGQFFACDVADADERRSCRGRGHRSARHASGTGQLCRDRHGGPHCRPRRPDAARSLRACRPSQPHRQFQHDAARGCRDVGRRARRQRPARRDHLDRLGRGV